MKKNLWKVKGFHVLDWKVWKVWKTHRKEVELLGKQTNYSLFSRIILYKESLESWKVYMKIFICRPGKFRGLFFGGIFNEKSYKNIY